MVWAQCPILTKAKPRGHEAHAGDMQRNIIQRSFRSLMGGEGDFSYEELAGIEKRRREILRRTELPFFRILLFWDGTVLKMMSRDSLLWITVILYVLVRVGAYTSLPDFVTDLGGADIGVIGGFLSFFLVFFVIESNTRFETQYFKSTALKGRIMDTASLARAHLTRNDALQLVRYMNAAHLAGYVGLSKTYTSSNFFDAINEEFPVLVPDEVATLELRNELDGGPGCCFELVTWCVLIIKRAMDDGSIDDHLAEQFREKILDYRECFSALFNHIDQPVPFFYVHFVCILSVMYLPLFAISSALEAGSGENAYWLNDIVTGLVVILQAIFVIGLRLLAIKMCDPYGEDVEDLSVLTYVTSVWKNTKKVMECSLPVVKVNEESMLVQRQRPAPTPRVEMSPKKQPRKRALTIENPVAMEKLYSGCRSEEP